MRITLAYDNTVYEGSVQSDRGFAAVIESDSRTILFDTGTKGTLLMDNLHALGFDPSAIDSVVLSHHHDDHVGGLQSLLDTGARPRVYFPSSFPRRLTKTIADTTEVVPVVDSQEVVPGIFSVVFSRQDGLLRRRFDEQALVAVTTDGIVLVTGCAHPGILFMTEAVRAGLSALGHAKQDHSVHSIALVMGGFHLMRMSRRRFDQVITGFQSLGVQRIMPAHCTGVRQIAWFAETYGDNCVTGGVGQTISFDMA